MQQDHTEQDYQHTDGQQDTGNHRKPAAPGGSDAFGGTRSGAENVEQPAPVTTIEKGTDVDRVADIEDLDESVSVNGPAERAPERDERGRL